VLILTIRTDKPEAEVGLFEGTQELAYEKWLAHRQLAETIHSKIEDLLTQQQKSWSDIEALACYKGPGSFTGLRIGLTVGNALASGLGVPVVSQNGKDWISKALKRLQKNENEAVAMPEYGSPVHITAPKI